MAGRVVVTGGAGFIGSHLVDRLRAAGDEVAVLDDLSSGSAANLDPSVRLVRGDVRDTALLEGLLAGADCVFHLAARVSVQDCIADWEGAHRVNLGGTLAVLRAAAAAGGVPVLYASSSAVYGAQPGGVCGEAMAPAPISPYAADKLAGEHQASALAAVHGLPSVGLRFFNVYGPRQVADSPYAGVISRFITNRLAGRPHVVYGDGGHSRDFIHVADVTRGLMLARARVAQGGASVFNLCTGTATTLIELAALIDRVAGRGATPITRAPARAGDIRVSRGLPDAARLGLGFTAEIPLAAGLQDLWSSLVAPATGNGASA